MLVWQDADDIDSRIIAERNKEIQDVEQDLKVRPDFPLSLGSSCLLIFALFFSSLCSSV
jgi:hypothetical protein